MRIESEDYILTFRRVGEQVEVTGDSSSLDCFTSGVVLAGPEDGSGVTVHSVPTEASDGVLRVASGTVALWLQHEVLNFL